MFKTKDIKEITIVVPKDKEEELINKLGQESLIHLKKIEENDFSYIKIDENKRAEIEKYYLYYSTVFKWLLDNGIVKKEPLEEELKKIKPFFDEDLLKKSNEIIEKLLEKIREYEKLNNEELLSLNRKVKLLKALDYLGVQTLDELKVKTLKIYFFILPSEKYKAFEQDKSKILSEVVELREFYDKENKEYYVLIISEKEFNFNFTNLLNEFLEEFKNENETKIHKLLDFYKQKLKEAKLKVEKLKEEIINMFKDYRYIILPALKYYKLQMEKLMEKEKFLETKNFSVVVGYIPSEESKKVREIVNSVTKDYIIEEKNVKEAPSLIKHENLKAYQELIEQYGTLQHNWFDPTIVFAIIFSLFYGFIIGDFGYGVVMLIIAYFLRKKGMLKASQVLFAGALSSMFFGILFGEFFSLSFYQPLIERIEPNSMLSLIVFSVIFGLLYLSFGALVAIYFSLKNKDFELFYSNLTFISFFTGLIGLGIGLYFKFAPLIYISLIPLAISIILALKENGILGLLEFSGYIGNVLSFARLAALGIAGSFIGFLINEFAKFLISKGLILGILGIVLAIILHTLNLGFGLIGGAIHSLRLNYLEFFSRFYKEGKEKFKAFGESSNKL